MALSGDVDSLALADLVQVNALSRRTCRVGLSGAAEGALFFEEGELVHAHYGELVGDEAVYAAVGESGVTFLVEQNMRATLRTISSGWRELLLNAMERIDTDMVPRPTSRRTRKSLRGYRTTPSEGPRRRSPLLVLCVGALALFGLGVAGWRFPQFPAPKTMTRMVRFALSFTRPEQRAVTQTFTPVASPPPASANSSPTKPTSSPTVAPVVMRIFFDRSNTYLHVSEQRLLMEIANQLRRPGTHALVLGHSNSTDAPETKRKLSLARAARVVDFLVHAGAPASGIEIEPSGSDGPLQSTAPDEESRDDRVDVFVFQP